MKKLYKKSEIWFSVVWIVDYIVLTSAADSASMRLGTQKLLTFPIHVLMTLSALLFVKKNGLMEKYGLCKPSLKASKCLYWLPLVLLSSVNVWFGVRLNFSVTESLLYVGSMICVGILEELIFRGFLFKAMLKDIPKTAVAVSALTFGIGHIVNLFNGSGAELLPTVCQIFHAVAFGWLCVVIFMRTKSIVPCIIAHSVINSLSAFSNSALSATTEIGVSLALCVIAGGYALYFERDRLIKKS